MNKISVVIGTFNQKDKLKNTLLSLFKQTLSPASYEIIVVDSSSTDGTGQMIGSLPKPSCEFRYIVAENKGKTFARNQGIDQAQGEIIFLTDADMKADLNLLMEHQKAHAKSQNSAFEGLTINPDNKPYIKEKIKCSQKLKFSYFLSGNLSIKKDTLVSVGKFDEGFKGYGWEDIELGYRLFKYNVPLYYLPMAINYHDHPVTNEDMLKRKVDMGKSAAYFLKKHPNMEIKLFLGINPIAIAIFNYINKSPNILKYIADQSAKSPFFGYLLEEYYYRVGLREAGAI
ncbi:MAG: family 2 glycosyl transferase [Candidatus Saganbacteria bacterium]|uniref:Family 2 glycosyl transferase n=1 Tax=Candidatus Saganbacteria bacterium TaxID=2575572 RepID=A0A833L1W8_UNCSA|nr:MAG: family 2 glycosyl transferase [Candidatus Saganbacteria bacterium]